jgi:hypothetical protein
MTQTSNYHKLLEGLVIDERYGIFRSFRRGAIIRAQEVGGVSDSDVNQVGQWRNVEVAKGRQAGWSMRRRVGRLVGR